MHELRRLWLRARPHPVSLAVGLGCALVLAPFDVLTTLLAQRAVETISRVHELHQRGELQGLLVLGAIVLPLFALVRGGAEFGARYAMARVAQSVLAELRAEIYRTLLERPVGYLQRRSPAEFVSRITTDVQRVESGLTLRALDLLVYGPSAIWLACLLWMISWRLAAVVTCVLPLAGLLVRHWGRRIKTASRRSQEETAKLASVTAESLGGIRIVKGYLAETSEIGRFHAANDALRSQTTKAYRTLVASSPILDVLTAVVAVILLGTSFHEILNGRLNGAQLAAFGIAMSFLYRSTKKISNAYTELQNTMAAARRCFDLLDEAECEPGGRIEVSGLERGLSLRGVDFAYGEAPVLRGLDLELPRGQTVALVGASGSGKTTIAALLVRFWDVDVGAITWDGVDLRQITPRSLRSQVAIVTQDAFVFDDTVVRNVAYGDPAPDVERVRAALGAANAAEFVEDLEHGLSTRLGPSGSRLSGGQRQRIAIARAFYKDAPVLVLDEATSSLDSRSEALVQEALSSLARGRTVLVVAHRLATVRDADRIVVLAEGRVVEVGSHQELIAREGAYWQLYGHQADGGQPEGRAGEGAA